jgi:adenylate cyclase
LRTFLPELARRKVFRVAVAYAAGAFVVRQGADFVLPATRVPGWAPNLVLVLTVLGSPIALVLAWALELSLEGSL